MSYVVLARKYRPQTFDELIGQDTVQRSLSSALRTEKIHHAYLFTGTRGVGKTTIARIFAKCLNCETKGITDQPCGTCPSCVEIQQGRFPDLIEIDAASRTKVEDTLTILENVKYAPTRGRYKIYLIDEVHMLSTHSFNALLKTLEEPPEHVKFLLATTDPQKLPITVLSRCLQFNLRKMRPADISRYLADVLGKEQVSFQSEALAMIAKAADGSMRDAMSITDQAISFGEGEIHAESVQTMLGLVQTQTLYPLADALKADDAQAMIDAVRDAAASVPDFLQLNQELIALFHRIALYQQLPDAVDQTDEMDVERLDAYAQSWTAEQVQLFYQITLSGHQDLIRAPDPAIAFEMLMLRLMVFIPEAVKAKKPQAGEQKARSSAHSQPVKQALPDAIATQASVSRDQSQVETHKRPEPTQLTQPLTPKAEQKSNPYAERSGNQGAENNRPEDQAQQASIDEARSVEGSDSSAQLEPVQPESTGQQIAAVADSLPNVAACLQANGAKNEHVSDAAQHKSGVDVWQRLLTSGPESKFACFEQLINALQLPQAVVNLLCIMDVIEVTECSMVLHVSQQDDIWYDEAHVRAFEQALAEYIGSAMAVGVEWQTGSVDNLRAFQKQRSQDRQAAMEEQFMSDPMVRFAIDELGGVVDMSSIAPISEQ